MPVMRSAAVVLLGCVAGCGGGDKLSSPPPSAPRQLTIALGAGVSGASGLLVGRYGRG
jgi:hypothetical protein